jgi:hypothetical protein
MSVLFLWWGDRRIIQIPMAFWHPAIRRRSLQQNTRKIVSRIRTCCSLKMGRWLKISARLCSFASQENSSLTQRWHCEVEIFSEYSFSILISSKFWYRAGLWSSNNFGICWGCCYLKLFLWWFWTSFSFRKCFFIVSILPIVQQHQWNFLIHQSISRQFIVSG